MGTVKDIRSGYCDEVYTTLADMKDRIIELQDSLACTYGAQDDVFKKYDRHLSDLADQIEWKLQILSHACSYDWKGSDDFEENTVSVGPEGTAADTEFSGGYLGG